MASPASKTPVSVLNEYIIRKGYLPKFELVRGGMGMLNPSFAYVVQCEDTVALGEGRSKQEAKHQAARSMLEKLKISWEDEYEEDVKQLVVPHENSVKYNAVGQLAEYCKKKCYPEEVYTKVSEVGPPHAKIFTMKCSVSQLSTFGEARTKKEAKHIAAHKMVMQLQMEAGEEPMAVAIPKKPTADHADVKNLPKVTALYQPQAHLYKDFCHAYINLQENSETLAKIFKDWTLVTYKTACKLVLDIVTELDVSLVVERVSQSDHEELSLNVMKEEYSEDENEAVSSDNPEAVFMTMNLYPPVVGVDMNVPKTALYVLEILKELSI